MKAVQFVGSQAPLELRNPTTPAPGPGEVLVRVTAAGICHSDAHYRAGTSPVGRTPLTLGHEVAGIVEAAASAGDGDLVGRRVCIHYLVTCGHCRFCRSGNEQFCPTGEMVGKHRDGGYAEYVCVPTRNAVEIPDSVPDAVAAIMMCSTATSFHALRQARLVSGETVAVIGCGGLGMSAIRLAAAMGAARIFAVDTDPDKLKIAGELGAEPVDGRQAPGSVIRDLTSGQGVDVAVELIGKQSTFELAVDVLAPKGRAALAGISKDYIQVRPYPDLINREAEVIGVSDHLLSELETILRWADSGELDLGSVISQTVPLDAANINAVLDDLDRGSAPVRTVIAPY